MKTYCVYTAIYGGYDALKEPPAQDVPCDFICFTDDPASVKSGNTWRIIPAHRPESHPRMQAKWFKVMSHQVFPHGRLAMHYDRRFWHRYDTVIWIDGSIQIKSPVFVRELSSYVGSSGWALLPHPDRDCVYDELGASMPMQKYAGQSLREQVAHYRVTGYPAQAGLWACGVIARTGRVSPQLRQLNEAWWAEIQHWSYQDQLSLPYLLRKLGVSVDRVPLNLWHNDQFEYVPHNRDD